jgi:nitroreductase
MAVTRLANDDLLACVEAAIAAPSIHNSQPWLFRIRDGGVDAYADRTRRLEAIDPSGRELLMSVGAATFNLRLAMQARSWEPATRLFPDADDPDLIAQVVPTSPASPSAALIELAEAIPRRHTNRRPFAPIPLPPTLLEELAAAAQIEGATLRSANPVAHNAVLGLVRIAEERLRGQGIYRAELSTVTRPHRGRHVMPPHTFGAWDALEALPLRDFGLKQPELRYAVEPTELQPTIAILYTDADKPEHWVAAGQALQRVLLLVTARGLAATPVSQPLEDPQLRKLMADPDAGPWAQVILRLGYGPPTARSRRRPLSDVLLDGR